TRPQLTRRPACRKAPSGARSHSPCSGRMATWPMRSAAAQAARAAKRRKAVAPCGAAFSNQPAFRHTPPLSGGLHVAVGGGKIRNCWREESNEAEGVGSGFVSCAICAVDGGV